MSELGNAVSDSAAQSTKWPISGMSKTACRAGQIGKVETRTLNRVKAAPNSMARLLRIDHRRLRLRGYGTLRWVALPLVRRR
jgi:hypothetical protein